MEHSIHKHTAMGFDTSSDAYDRGRPDHPTEAVDCLIRELALNSNKIVADIGAGTGKLTKLIKKSDAKIIASEPVEGMRRKFSSLLPEVQVLSGTAESIPLENTLSH